MEKQYLCIGKVSSINYPKGTARVTYEDKNKSTTAEFSFLAWEYWMPEIGDQVVVAHLSNGRTSATVLGPVWHNDHRPPEGFKGLYRNDFNREYGKAYERYDHNTGVFTLHIGTVTVTIDASGSVTIDADTVTVNAKDTNINGNLTVKGGVVNLN